MSQPEALPKVLRPVRVDQVIPSIVERDAVSRHTLEAQRVLRSMGFVSEIFACTWGPGLHGRVRPLHELPHEGERQWICYQASIGSPAAEAVLAHPGTKIVNYHNITPSELVGEWMPSLGEEVRLGRRQMAELAPLCQLGIGVSAYNAGELRDWGCPRTAVAALMAELGTSTVSASPQRRQELERAKADGGADWLFVGQMLPHKAHHDVVKSFAAFLELFDPGARLHLVGRPSCGAYALAVRRLAERAGVAGSVDLAGSVSPEELVAYYLAADVFVSCSDHEGFGAPLLEAMHYGVPVVAYSAGAVPETVLGAGITLPSKDPLLVATAAHRVIADGPLRAILVDRGRERAHSFTLEGARRAFRIAIESLLVEDAGAAPIAELGSRD